MRLRIVKFITAVFISVLIICIFRNTPPGPSFFGKVRSENLSEKQDYAQPLNWLETHIKEPTVIWANEPISAYVPIMTKHYVLFHRDAALHFLPSSEHEDRYLLSRSADDLTLDDLKNEVIAYTSHGLYLRAWYQNRDLKYCEALSRFGIQLECPERTSPVMLMGDEYFYNLEGRFGEIKKNQKEFLQTYHVGYRIIDRKHDNFDNSSAGAVLFDDGRFVIISISSTTVSNSQPPSFEL
jgi:hypothetical protein